MTQVAVYNPGGATPLTRVPLRHAIGMLQRRVATILEEVPGERFGPYPKPRALVLIRYVYEKWKWSGKGPVRYSKRECWLGTATGARTAGAGEPPSTTCSRAAKVGSRRGSTAWLPAKNATARRRAAPRNRPG